MFKYLDKLLIFLGISFDKNYDEDYDYNNITKNNSKNNEYKINVNTLNKENKKNDIMMKEITINIDKNDNNDNYDKNKNLVSLNCFCNCNDDNSNYKCYDKCSNITSNYIYFTFYKCFIFLVLLFTPSLYIYDIIVNNNKDIIPTISFTIMQPIMYIIIHDVFSTNYFLKIYHESHNPKYKKIHYCLPNEKRIVISVITISIISSIVSFIFYLITEKAFIYKELDNLGDVFITILYILNWIYGRLILSLSFNIFFYVFIKQLKDLKYTYYKI